MNESADEQHHTLAERGIAVSDETIRQGSRKFGSEYARKLKRRQGVRGDIWHSEELFVTIQGKRQYLWRAISGGLSTRMAT